MKTDWEHLARWRDIGGEFYPLTGNEGGRWIIRHGRADLCVIAGRGLGWDHVSVSVRELNGRRRIPTWEEMCWIKDQFWDEEECAVQYHPPRSEYVNYCPFCLHLWRSLDAEMPRPPSVLVGPKMLA